MDGRTVFVIAHPGSHRAQLNYIVVIELSARSRKGRVMINCWTTRAATTACIPGSSSFLTGGSPAPGLAWAGLQQTLKIGGQAMEATRMDLLVTLDEHYLPPAQGDADIPCV